VVERRRDERGADASHANAGIADPFESPRSTRVEALLHLVDASLTSSDEQPAERTRLVVHVDADALTSDGRGRSELDDGPVIAPETARRLGCDQTSWRRWSGTDSRSVSVASDARCRRRFGGSSKRATTRPAASGLRAPPALPGAPSPPLGARRRDEPREPHAPVLPPPPAGARGGATRSRTTPPGAFASETGTASSARTRHRDPRPAARTSSSPQTSSADSISALTPTATAATAGNASI